MFSGFIVYLDIKSKSLDELQKHLMHLEVRLSLRLHIWLMVAQSWHLKM